MHSISTYVQQIVRRDFLDDRAIHGRPATEHWVIPSFREDDSDAVESTGENDQAADLQGYLGQLPSTPFILFVGALRVVKGLGPLVAAYQRLRAPPPLVLIGTIESDTPPVFPPGVVVLQKFPHRAVMAVWDRCLFGVLPSLWPEPLGSVVYEGMSRGKAVIGTTPGGHTDMIIHGETGLLVPLGDVDALVDAMQRLLDQPELRTRLGQAGRVRAKLFTAEVVLPQFESVYSQLVAESAGRINENHSLPVG
jgi:glycosyltransferase involved in cell wall biosynthesis